MRSPRRRPGLPLLSPPPSTRPPGARGVAVSSFWFPAGACVSPTRQSVLPPPPSLVACGEVTPPLAASPTEPLAKSRDQHRCRRVCLWQPGQRPGLCVSLSTETWGRTRPPFLPPASLGAPLQTLRFLSYSSAVLEKQALSTDRPPFICFPSLSSDCRRESTPVS